MEVMNLLLGWLRDSSSEHEQSINQDSQKKQIIQQTQVQEYDP